MLIDLSKLNEELISPEQYLKLTPEQKRNIVKATPYVKPLGSVDLDDPGFAYFKVKWKIPKYKVDW